MKKLVQFGVVVSTILLLGGCAVGRKMSYENKEIRSDYPVKRTVMAVFQDKRAEVLSGAEKPSWCGHMNSTAQIPYNMQTESGKPLAEEFTNSIASSFRAQGVDVAGMPVHMHTTGDSIVQVFLSGNQERLMHFTINKWESSASPRFSDIHYEVIADIDLKITDRNGRQLAFSNAHDVVAKNQDLAVNVKHLQAMADEVFMIQVRKLLNDESVKGSLQ